MEMLSKLSLQGGDSCTFFMLAALFFMTGLLRCLKCLATEPKPLGNASKLPYSLSVASPKPEEPAAMPAQPEGNSTRSCTFFMLSADFVRQFPGKSLPFF